MKNIYLTGLFSLFFCSVSFSQSKIDSVYLLLGMMSQDVLRSYRPDYRIKLIHFYTSQKNISETYIEILSKLDEKMGFGHKVYIDDNKWIVVDSKKWKDYFDSKFFCLKKNKDSWLENENGIEYSTYKAFLKKNKLKTRKQKLSFLIGAFLVKGHFEDNNIGVLLGVSRNVKKNILFCLKALDFKLVNKNVLVPSDGIYSNRLSFIFDNQFKERIEELSRSSTH